MDREALLARLRAMLEDVAPHVTITEQDHDKALSDLGYDSLDEASFLLAIEEHLEVKIPDEDSAALMTLSAYADYILKTST